jgi:hypothetical protein
MDYSLMSIRRRFCGRQQGGRANDGVGLKGRIIDSGI